MGKLERAAIRATVALVPVLLAAFAAAPASAVDDHTLYLGGSFATNIFPGTGNGPGLAGINIRDAGSLGTIGGSPFGPAGTPAEQVAITPDNRFLYASSAGTQQVLAFSVGNGGRLTSIPGFVTPPGPPDPDPSVIAIAPDGSYAYVTDPGPSVIRILTIGDDGAISQQGVVPISGVTNLFGAAITPDGKHLYATATEGVQSRVYGFTVGSDGGLTQFPGAGIPISTGTSTISITPDGSHLYSATDGGAVNGFNIAGDGTLSATSGSPYGSGFSGALAVSPSTARLYATRSDTPGPSGVAVFTYATDGALTQIAGSPFASSRPTDTIAVPPDDRFVFAAGGDASTMTSGFTVGAGGVLSVNTGAGIFAGPYFPSPGSSTVSPNQPPIARLSVSRGSGIGKVVFDGSASTDTDGETARWAIDFGDGDLASNPSGPPAATHKYVVGSVYDAALTMTDDEGCSTTFVFTGQTASCNGSGVARKAVEIDLVPPQLKVSTKRRQTLDRAVSAKLSCDDPCDVKGSGKVVAKPRRSLGRRIKLKAVHVAVSTGSRKLRLKLSKHSRAAVEKALAAGAELTAKVKFIPSKTLVDGKPVKRKVEIQP